MNTLNNREQIKKLDKSNILGSIEIFDKQVEQAWQETKQLKIPASYKKVKNVVINGMGGSALGGHIIKSLYGSEVGIPIEVINSYYVPNYVDADTLYLISSFSGTTEEPISTYEEAKKRGAKILAITAGGKLSEMMRKYQIPGYDFKAIHNPCNQPRIAVAYSIVGQLGLLNKCGVIKVKDAKILAVQNYLKNLNEIFGVGSEKDNPAKKLALKFKNKIIILVAGEFLAGNVHAFANQINENSKNFSAWFLIPELNHHLMEGLGYPLFNKNDLLFVFLESDLYHPRVQKRFAITKEVVQKNKVDFASYQLKTSNKLKQSFELLALGSYTAFYLAILNNLDPSPILWVDYFKEQLSK